MNKDILLMQHQIEEMKQQLLKNQDNLKLALDAEDLNLSKRLSDEHCSNLKHYLDFNEALVTLYENEITKLQDCQNDCPVTVSQKKQIEKETKLMENICSVGLRESGDVQSITDTNLFHDMLHDFEEKCPLLHSVLENLLVTDHRRRVHKTVEYKLTCGVNALALLLSVRNQMCKNDVSLLLGLVCITYGAGKQFINLLHAVGLTPHWDTLYVNKIISLHIFPSWLFKTFFRMNNSLLHFFPETIFLMSS